MLVSEDFLSVLLGIFCLSFCVSILSDVLSLLKELGESSFLWVCPPGQSVTSFESSWSLFSLCLSL